MGAGKALGLIILDGWGLREEQPDNAIALAKTPFMDAVSRSKASTQLVAHGEAVGLLPGQMGNSNVGHLNLGAGRVVYQDLSRISVAIHSGELYGNDVLARAMARADERGSRLHLIGLVSDGGVHSHIDHLKALVQMAQQYGIKEVYVHFIADGRDVPPRSAERYVMDLERELSGVAGYQIATVSGRYYTMDRDRRWDRTKLAFAALIDGRGKTACSALEAVREGYRRGEDDEFLQPTIVSKQGTIGEHDQVIMFNFRPDRMRQITRALYDREFTEMDRGHGYSCRQLVTMTEYDRSFNLPVAFSRTDLVHTLGEVVSRAGLRQLRLAETEKYAHVTYFLSGGREQVFMGEDRVLIPSPQVATYDLQPEMSASQVADRAVQEITSGQYQLIVVNFANADMVGHTGILSAAVKAVEAVDNCVGRVVDALLQADHWAVIVSDHGNAEQMVDKNSSQPHTAHTTSPVPCIVLPEAGYTLNSGILADVAPTCLRLMGLDIPREMTGKPLIVG